MSKALKQQIDATIHDMDELRTALSQKSFDLNRLLNHYAMTDDSLHHRMGSIVSVKEDEVFHVFVIVSPTAWMDGKTIKLGYRARRWCSLTGIFKTADIPAEEVMATDYSVYFDAIENGND